MLRDKHVERVLGSSDLLGKSGQPVRPSSCGDHVEALRDEPARGRGADAARATGDDGARADEIHTETGR